MSNSTIFPYRYWHYCQAAENLFDLTADELDWFLRFVDEAVK